jgi:hypothetical protein
VSSAQKAGKIDYYPMRPGIVWTYDTKIGDVQIKQTATVTERKKTSTGEQAAIEWRMNDQLIQKEVYLITPSALMRIEGGGGSGGQLSPPMPVIKYPLKSGSKWSWAGNIQAQGQTIKSKADFVVSGPLTIKTPAGSFKNVMRIHYTVTMTPDNPQKLSQRVTGTGTRTAAWQGGRPGTSLNQTLTIPTDLWVAPGIGPVKQEATFGVQKIKVNLLSYKLK